LFGDYPRNMGQSMQERIRYLILISAIFLGAIIVAALAGRDTNNALTSYGTLAAVFAALFIALRSAQQTKEEASKQAAAAAILISQVLFELRAILDVVTENEELVRPRRSDFAVWFSALQNHLALMPPILRKRHLLIATRLESIDLHVIAVCDEWFRKLKKKHLHRSPVPLDRIVATFDTVFAELVAGHKIVSAASNRMHAISGVKGVAPWDQTAPSWAIPIDRG
jgi:hypothetical protein